MWCLNVRREDHLEKDHLAESTNVFEKVKTKGNQKQTKKKPASEKKKTLKKTMKATTKKPASENKKK
eukprot:13146148-Heterocapsa_arctica.AAC.1